MFDRSPTFLHKFLLLTVALFTTLSACKERDKRKDETLPKKYKVKLDLGLLQPFPDCPWAFEGVIIETKDEVFADALTKKDGRKIVLKNIAVNLQAASCTTLAQPSTRQALEKNVAQSLAGTYRNLLKRSVSPPKIVFVMKRGKKDTSSHGQDDDDAKTDESDKDNTAAEGKKKENTKEENTKEDDKPEP